MMLAGCGHDPAPRNPPHGSGDEDAEATLPRWYVATNGNDGWSGRLSEPNRTGTDGPLATLEAARQRLRDARRVDGLPRGAVVVVRGGRYELASTFRLGAEDSGRRGAPVIYRDYPGEVVVLSGAKTVGPFRSCDGGALFRRLPDAAREHVVVADLASAGIKDAGVVSVPHQRPDLFYRDQPMILARWPNGGFARVGRLVGGHPVTAQGLQGDAVGAFEYEGDEPARWSGEPDPWLHGYWFWDWADHYEPLASVDVTAHTIQLAPPYSSYGYRSGQRFYALNLVSELDAPGEWYLDRSRGEIYFWPPGDLQTGDVTISALPTVAAFVGAEWIRFEGVVFEGSRANAVTIEGGDEVSLLGCVLRNAGGWGLSIDGGSHHSVAQCDVAETGEGGISLSGGNRVTLTPAGHTVEDSHIWSFGRFFPTYRPAIQLAGVGNVVRHNLVHDGPHDAIQISGNDHVVEWNEVHDVARETGDVGALYMGRDWTSRGTMIRNNYFHDLQPRAPGGVMAVYLDDATSGITVTGNLFDRAGQCVFIGGGRDNVVTNNVFVDCAPSIHVDARGLGWMHGEVEPEGSLQRTLRAVPYQAPLWSARYPRLATILTDEPGAPSGNVVRHNVSVSSAPGAVWLDVDPAAQPFLTSDSNLANDDPRFVDPARHDFRLRADSPALRLGFEPVPFERAGLYPTSWRSRLPRASR